MGVLNCSALVFSVMACNPSFLKFYLCSMSMGQYISRILLERIKIISCAFFCK